MEMVSTPTIIGCLVGTFGHIIKKGVEASGEDTFSAIRRWLFGKPASTLVALLGGLGVAMGIQLPTDTPVAYQVINGVLSGFAATSIVNRPGGE
jgi:hypothetical protein